MKHITVLCDGFMCKERWFPDLRTTTIRDARNQAREIGEWRWSRGKDLCPKCQRRLLAYYHRKAHRPGRISLVGLVN